MASIKFHINNSTKTTSVQQGKTILQAALQGRVALPHKCGGKASCLTCKVKIADQSNVSEPGQKEIRKLGESNLAKQVRLGCQTRIFGEVQVSIPEDPYKARIRKLLEQARANV